MLINDKTQMTLDAFIEINTTLAAPYPISDEDVTALKNLGMWETHLVAGYDGKEVKIPVMRTTKGVFNRTDAAKKKILLSHYTMDEIQEIMGFDDDSNEDVCAEEFQEAYEKDYPKFQEMLLKKAIENGNFEWCIMYDTRVAT